MPPPDRRFIFVDAELPDHPKVIGLTDKAFRLLITTWCWSRAYRTEGLVPAAKWKASATRAARTELVKAGLVDEAFDGNVIVHDWDDWQRTSEQIAAVREAKKVGGAKGNHLRWHVGRGVSDLSCEFCRQGAESA